MISGCFVDVSISERSGRGWIGGICVMAVGGHSAGTGPCDVL
jgi:hypothetical protein